MNYYDMDYLYHLKMAELNRTRMLTQPGSVAFARTGNRDEMTHSRVWHLLKSLLAGVTRLGGLGGDRTMKSAPVPAPTPAIVAKACC